MISVFNKVMASVWEYQRIKCAGCADIQREFQYKKTVCTKVGALWSIQLQCLRVSTNTKNNYNIKIKYELTNLNFCSGTSDVKVTIQ
jgi:hypothetical protein